MQMAAPSIPILAFRDVLLQQPGAGLRGALDGSTGSGSARRNGKRRWINSNPIFEHAEKVMLVLIRRAVAKTGSGSAFAKTIVRGLTL